MVSSTLLLPNSFLLSVPWNCFKFFPPVSVTHLFASVHGCLLVLDLTLTRSCSPKRRRRQRGQWRTMYHAARHHKKIKRMRRKAGLARQPARSQRTNSSHGRGKKIPEFSAEKKKIEDIHFPRPYTPRDQLYQWSGLKHTFRWHWSPDVWASWRDKVLTWHRVYFVCHWGQSRSNYLQPASWAGLCSES